MEQSEWTAVVIVADCPDWCTGEHPPMDVDPGDGGTYISHAVHVGSDPIAGIAASICQWQTRDGFFPAAIEVTVPDELTASAASDLAVWLAQAADFLAGVNGQPTPAR